MIQYQKYCKRVGAITLVCTLLFSGFSKIQPTQAASTFAIPNKVTIGKGETFQLTTKGTSSKITFRSSNNKVVSVTKSGKMKGKKIGKATITAKIKNKTRKCKITVKAAPKKVSFSQKEITLLPGKTRKLAIHFSSGYSNQFTYKSKNTSVATVSANGVVTAKTAGKTTITAKTFNGKTATIRCIVTESNTTPSPATISPTATSTSVPTATPQAIVTTSASISKIENGTIYINNNSITLGLTSCISYFKMYSNGSLYRITKEDLMPGDTIQITYSGLIAETYPATLCDCDTILVTNSLGPNEPPYMHKNPIPIEKPIIYLYPKEKTDITVDLDFKGELTYTYPYTTDGHWEVTADTDGTLTNKADNFEYSYLFWEGKYDNFVVDFSKGFCVKGEDTTKFLQTILPKIGLTQKEYNEFIVYWAPRMQENAYNLISFQAENYEQIAPLHITPAPDSMLRVYMAYKPLTKPIDIEPQTFEPFERTGFSVVEWGGCMVNN